MLENMTTGEKALIGATAIGIAALVFHKPTRNAVGLSDGRRAKKTYRVARDTGRGYSPIFVEANTKKEAILIAKKLKRKDDQDYIKRYKTNPSMYNDKYNEPRPIYEAFEQDEKFLFSGHRVKQRGGKYKPSRDDIKNAKIIEMLKSGKL